MIVLYNDDGHEVGRYDTASDLWIDYPDAEVHGSKAVTKESN